MNTLGSQVYGQQRYASLQYCWPTFWIEWVSVEKATRSDRAFAEKRVAKIPGRRRVSWSPWSECVVRVPPWQSADSIRIAAIVPRIIPRTQPEKQELPSMLRS